MRLEDVAPAERDAIAKVRLQVEHRRWMAGVYDHEQFSEAGPDVNVTVNVAQLHLDALRHRMTDDTPRIAPERERLRAAPSANYLRFGGTIVPGV